jgi:Na+/H+-dicarboxylate symporter
VLAVQPDTVKFASVTCIFVFCIAAFTFNRRGGDDAISTGEVVVALLLGLFNFVYTCTSEKDSEADA